MSKHKRILTIASLSMTLALLSGTGASAQQQPDYTQPLSDDRFEEEFCGRRRERYLNKLIPEIGRSVFPGDEENAELEIQHNGRDYQVHLSKVSMEGFSETEDVLHIPREKILWSSI